MICALATTFCVCILMLLRENEYQRLFSMEKDDLVRLKEYGTTLSTLMDIEGISGYLC